MRELQLRKVKTIFSRSYSKLQGQDIDPELKVLLKTKPILLTVLMWYLLWHIDLY